MDKKLSNHVNNEEDYEIEEDIQYEGKFDNIEDVNYEDDQDQFVESISIIK